MATVKLSTLSGNTHLKQQWLQEAQQAGGISSYDGKRNDPRTNWQEPLEVHYSVGRGRTKTVYATARDLSAAGIAFECREAIPAYTEVLICRTGQVEGLRATTLHCTRTLNTFIVGCRTFTDEEPIARPQSVAKAG